MTREAELVAGTGRGDDANGRGGGLARSVASSIGERGALLLAWALLFLFFTVLPATSDLFPTSANISTILGSSAVTVLLTLGLLIPLTAGDYDLSIAFTLTLSAMVLALLNVEQQWPLWVALLAALATGAVVGLVNGALVVLFDIDPFIVTLGTGTFVGGVVFWISSSDTITGIASGLTDAVIVNRLFGIPLEFYYGLAVCIVIWYVFEYTAVGRRLLIVGRGRDVARLSGIHVGRLRWGAFVAAGVVSAAAGILYAGTTGGADPSSGTQLLLPAYAAAFLGATTIVPGRFNPWGSFAAIYFLATGISGLQLLGAASFVQNLFYGGALVVAVGLAQVAKRRQAQKAVRQASAYVVTAAPEEGRAT